MSTVAGQPDAEIPERERYTYEDYQQLPEGAPYELIRGQLVLSPSPSSSHRDVLDKKQLYESTGVREYWIIDPDTETVEIYVPGKEGYVLDQRHVSTGRASSSALEGFDVDLVALIP